MVRDLVDVVQRAVLLCCLSLALLGFATHAGGCALNTSQGRTTQLDPDVDDNLGGTGIESGDIRGASEQIARAVVGELKHKRPRIAMLPVANLTRFRIDPGLLRNRLTHDLVSKARGRFSVIPLDGEERAHVDYLLKTELRSETKDSQSVGATSDYVQYSFVLERAEDGFIEWTGMYETKRLSSVDVIYQ